MQYLFGTANRLPVAFATPSLYTVYDAPPELGPAAVIGISQSGASPDVVAVLDEARKQGRPTLAITNDPRPRSRSPRISCRCMQARSAPSQRRRRT